MKKKLNVLLTKPLPVRDKALLDKQSQTEPILLGVSQGS